MGVAFETGGGNEPNNASRQVVTTRSTGDETRGKKARSKREETPSPATKKHAKRRRPQLGRVFFQRERERENWGGLELDYFDSG